MDKVGKMIDKGRLKCKRCNKPKLSEGWVDKDMETWYDKYPDKNWLPVYICQNCLAIFKREAK